MFSRELQQSGHVRRFTVQESGGGGWEVREEEDSRLLRQSHYHDWHRVERAMTSFDLQAAQLERMGWRTSGEW